MILQFFYRMAFSSSYLRRTVWSALAHFLEALGLVYWLDFARGPAALFTNAVNGNPSKALFFWWCLGWGVNMTVSYLGHVQKNGRYVPGPRSGYVAGVVAQQVPHPVGHRRGRRRACRSPPDPCHEA